MPGLRTAVIAGTVACAIASAFALSPGARSYAAPYEHVTNGGFEDGPAGWSSSEPAAFSTDADDVPPASGTRRGRLVLDGTTLLTQTLFDVQAGSYEFSLRVRLAMPMVTPARVQVLPPDRCTAGCDLEVPNVAGDWQPLSTTVVLSEEADVALRIFAPASSGNVLYVDDVRFTGAPPATRTPTPTATVTATAVPAASATSTRTSATPTATVTATAEALTITAELRNEGFEDAGGDGTPEGWSKYGGVLASSGRARTGERAAELTSETESTKWLYQTVLVDGGSGYEFAAWVLDDDAAVARASLRVSWYATADGSGSAIAADDSTEDLTAPAAGFRRLTTGPVRSPAEARSARVRVLLDPADANRAAIVVDDASWERRDIADALVATPEPLAAAEESVPPDGEAPEPVSIRGESTARAPDTASEDVSVVINEVLYDPDGAGRDADGEWVELYNAGDDPIELAGWSIEDNKAADVLPSQRIAPRGFAILTADERFASRYPDAAIPVAVIEGDIGNSLGNDGDRLILKDASGRTVDAVSWGTDTSALDPAVEDVPEGHSIERRTAGADSDSASDWVDNARPTPGGPIGPSTPAAGPPRESATSPVAARGGAAYPWLPWALMAAASAGLAGAVGWQTLPRLSSRLRSRRT